MKMKRKSITLWLALMMCLFLLSACGANNTPDTEEKNNAGTEFLALLQEEYENGFFQGEGPRHTYYINMMPAFIHNGIVYVQMEYRKFGAYDIVSKEFNENFCSFLEGYHNIRFIDGNFYTDGVDGYLRMCDRNGALLNRVPSHGRTIDRLPFDKGFLCLLYDGSDYTMVLFSYNLEEIAEIPFPQHEMERGLTEDMELSYWFAADETVYAYFIGDDFLYRLNTDTYEWENTGNAPASIDGQSFFGKYISCNDGIYDRITGERVFEYGELYHGAEEDDAGYYQPCYFGGDKYLGRDGLEYRWVSLTDLSMSDPLSFPERKGGRVGFILNDTYYVYRDEYGWFLWNYNDGTEETIVMFDMLKEFK